jgi:hypothetical protein
VKAAPARLVPFSISSPNFTPALVPDAPILFEVSSAMVAVRTMPASASAPS